MFALLNKFLLLNIMAPEFVKFSSVTTPVSFASTVYPELGTSYD